MSGKQYSLKIFHPTNTPTCLRLTKNYATQKKKFAISEKKGKIQLLRPIKRQWILPVQVLIIKGDFTLFENESEQQTEITCSQEPEYIYTLAKNSTVGLLTSSLFVPLNE